MVKLSAIGQSEPFLNLLEEVARLAKLDRPVLILGERGTGKELVAHRLHYLSRRWEEPMVSLNCGAIRGELLSSELFGHEKGAFTGANERKLGRIERAESGTLFLDELATSETPFQEALLRVLEQGQYERVGGNQTLQADIRIIAATNLSPEELYCDEVVRQDLLDRLSFAIVQIPPLRDRKEDIPHLCDHFNTQFTQELQWFEKPTFSDHATEELLEHHWPGNIRELKNTVERSLFHYQGEEVERIIWSPFSKPQQTLEPSNSTSSEQALPSDLKEHLHQIEKDCLTQAYRKAHGQHKIASELLGLTYHQWRAYLKKHDLKKGELSNF